MREARRIGGEIFNGGRDRARRGVQRLDADAVSSSTATFEGTFRSRHVFALQPSETRPDTPLQHATPSQHPDKFLYIFHLPSPSFSSSVDTVHFLAFDIITGWNCIRWHILGGESGEEGCE